jgi:hypothetical protein
MISDSHDYKILKMISIVIGKMSEEIQLKESAAELPLVDS